MVKPEAEIANSSRVPNARDRNPDSGIAITSAIRYEVWTHDTSLELADRPAWISLQRCRDDLDVQDRHEHPEHHDEKRKQPPRRDALGRRAAAFIIDRRCGGGVGHDLLGSGRSGIGRGA